MIKEISWAGYLTFIAILLIVYYIVVIILFYREDMIRLFAGREALPFFKITSNMTSKTLGDIRHSDNASKQIKDTAEQQFEDDFPEVTKLLEELKELIQTAGVKKYAREEILLALQLKLAPHKRYRNTVFLAAINNTIENEIETHCSIHLGIEELNMMWKV